MMSRSNPLRWLAALLLITILSSGLSATAIAQEEGTGATPAPTATAAAEGDVSIGEDSSTVIAEETEASQPEQSDEGGSEPSTDGTETGTPTEPSGGIGGDEGTGIPTGEGTPTPDPSATETPTEEGSPSPSPTSTPTEAVEAASVGVSVTIYTCSSAYDGGNPAGDANCSPASGVGVLASTSEGPIGGAYTNGSGVASFDAPEDQQVVFVEEQETLPSGYVPDGNGTASVTAGEGASAYIANIQVSTAGRLQISNGQCPTSEEARTEFIVVGPLAIQASALGCAPLAGASLTVTGPGGSYSVVTDAGGSWIGTVPVGSYTISNANSSAGLEVVSGATTIVLVVDYVPGAKGTLNVERFECGDGDEGTTISIGGGPNNASCVPSDRSVSVASAEGGAAPLVIDLGEDGSTSVEVAAGDYIVTDGPTGASAPVQVTEGETITASINSTVRTGAIAASLFWCSESVSGSVDPNTWGNWTTGCSRAGSGIVVSLIDGNGNVVSTSSTGGNGSISFSSLVPGTYSLSSSSGCALFANGADARNGFTIAAGDTVEIAAFGCEEPSYVPEEPEEPGPDPGSIGGGNGNPSGGGGSIGNGDALGNGSGFSSSPFVTAGFHTRNLSMNPLANVSTLPATGEGTNGMANQTMLMLLGLAALAAGAAVSLQPARAKRSR
jgi:hypothetical protein